jgi:CelD/BcsL family acetyltransferase involved in cellulose biosynthesis
VLHHEIPDDPDLRRQWNEIVFQMESPQAFYTWEWAFAVQSAYRESLRPWLVLAYENEELVGLASLACDSREQNFGFLAAATSDYCDFVSRPETRARLMDAVFGKLHETGIETVNLASIPADSSSVAALLAAAGGGRYRVFRRPAQVCAQVVLGSGEKREQLRTTLLGKKLLRRSLRGMEARGLVALTHLRSRPEIESNLAHFVRDHIARFLVTRRISNVTRPERRFFLQELGRLLSDSAWICLSRLSVGERTVAWNYGFQFAGSWFWYQPTFDSRMEHYSPGYCLLTKIVTEACTTSNLDVVDLGVGAEGYKERFANGVRQTLDFSLNQSVWSHGREALYHWGARAVKISPKAESAIRGALRRLDLVRRHSRDAHGLVGWSATRARRAISRQDEVFFYEWPENSPAHEISPSFELKPLDLELLAESATLYFDDSETMNYLLRAAQRLHREDVSGFALTVPGRGPVHYSWIRDFEGFYMDELNIRLTAPVRDSVMIFDCWTPRAVRGHGYYGFAVSRAAEYLRSTGKSPWIFSAAQNGSSIHGIEKSAFQRRYSLVRRKILFWQQLRKRSAAAIPVTEALVSR